jgi:hypothetical protein
MHVQNAQAQMSPLNTRETYATRTNMGDDQKSASKASLARASDTPPATNNAVTGTTGSRLSARTTAELIKATQQAEDLSERDKSLMREIANNPALASQMARTANGPDPIKGINLSSNILTAADKAGLIPLGDTTHPTAIMLNQRGTMAEGELKQGTPSAEVYMHILEFNANLPQSYGDSLDQTGQTPPGAWNKHQQAMADYLKQAIAQTNSSAATGEPS